VTEAIRELIIPAIQSAVTAEEARALASLARGRTVLELGAQFGYSTVVLASVADLVISVDWHQGDPHAGEWDTWDIFNANLARYGVQDRVQAVVGRFEDVLPRMEAAGDQFDGAFLDGSHDEASVARDLSLVLPLIRTGGFVAFHDYGRGPETGHPDFAVTPVADRFGVSGQAGFLAWGFT
jgi:predicted O-methyltransferase YrrM